MADSAKQDYSSITDIVKYKEPYFKPFEFERFGKNAKLNIFKQILQEKIIMTKDYKNIVVLDRRITVTKDDYISLTDMLKAKDGDFFISDWLRNRNTLEYLGIWEKIHNPDFNYGEFAIIKSQAGLNRFKISVKEWVAKTNAIGLTAKAGRYGGTYAHKDIAFEFGMWISAEFKIFGKRIPTTERGRTETTGLGC